MRILLTAVLAMALFGAMVAEPAAQAVKKSKSGICHCPGGSYYERTRNFTPFDTIKACLDSGGREPKRGQGDCSKASPPPSALSTHEKERSHE